MEALSTFREATGMRLISLKQAVIGTFRALKENRSVLLVADRVVGRGSMGIELPFASGIRPIPTGPATFAIRSGAPTIIGHDVRATKPPGVAAAVRPEPPTADDSAAARATRTRRLTGR